MIYKYLNYKEYVNDYVASLPKGGRGQYKKLADSLGISTVVVSQTFKGDRDLNPETAFGCAKFLGLNRLETKYFLTMVDYAKAGNFRLQSFLKESLEEIKKEARKVESRYANYKKLKDEDKAIFYSDRIFSSVRVGSSLPSLNTIDDIITYFGLTENKGQEVIEFLINTKLCLSEGGKLTPGPQHTFVPNGSPFLQGHHKNWRQYAIERSRDLNTEHELMYTSPMSMSEKTYEEVRNQILKLIENVLKEVGPSKEETLACLNIDFLKF